MRRKADIAPVQFIIEGYEGMATVSTIDAENAVIRVSVMQDFIKEMAGVLRQLETDFKITPIPDFPVAMAKMNSPKRPSKQEALFR